MKKTLIVLLIIFSFNSCSSQTKKKINITGNWFNYENTTSKDFFYVETFIDKDSIYFYNSFAGLTPNYNYIIEDSILYFKNENKKIESGIIKVINENTISMNRKDGYLILKRIIGKGVKLEDFLFRGKTEDEYWEDFNKRKIAWEKEKAN